VATSPHGKSRNSSQKRSERRSGHCVNRRTWAARTNRARRSRPVSGDYEGTEGDVSSTEQQASGIERTDLQQHDLSVPGREVVQNRVDISPEAPAFEHTHPGEEIIYVLEGSLEYQVEGKPPTTLNAGEVFFVPAETIHAVKNVGTCNAAELATYVVEKGKPLVVLVE
jgi:quercetin dioxygenase-like cupin family protein